jgi:hypothetical protein
MKRLLRTISKWLGFSKKNEFNTECKPVRRYNNEKKFYEKNKLLPKDFNSVQNLHSIYNGGVGVYRDSRGRFSSIK